MKICVATDLSDSGRAAIEAAWTWAAKLPANVTLLHVVHDPELAPALASDVPGDVLRARRELDALSAAAPAKCSVDVRTADDVADAIVAASADCDYLFVGAQGKSAFQRLRLGSVATAVLRRSKRPVVCCPRRDGDASPA